MNYDIKITGDERDNGTIEFANGGSLSVSNNERGEAKNPLAKLLGQWPGDETDAEFEEILKNMGR